MGWQTQMDRRLDHEPDISTRQLFNLRAILQRSGANADDLDAFAGEFQRIVDEGHSIDTAVDNLLARMQLIVARRNQRWQPPSDGTTN